MKMIDKKIAVGVTVAVLAIAAAAVNFYLSKPKAEESGE